MVLARGRALSELVALIVAALGIAASLAGGSELGPGLLKASGVALAVGFGLLSLHRTWPVLTRAGLSLLIAAVALGIWCQMKGIHWSDLERTFTAALVATYHAVPGLSRDPATQRQLQDLIGPMIASAPDIGRVMPGLLGLQGLAGMGLAGVWQHRLARNPTGPAPLAFRRFRFNDHLIWGAILTLASLLAPLPAAGRALAISLLVVWAGLYGFRGLAVLTALLAGTPVSVRVAAAGLAVLLNPIALGACLAVGLADTWIDIRGRLLPPAPERGSQ